MKLLTSLIVAFIFNMNLSTQTWGNTILFNELKRVPASQKDLGVIGPRGEVQLYYSDGDYIMVAVCEPNTVLGMTPTQARDNCQPPSNKIPVEAFKKSLREIVSSGELVEVLQPLTPEEVKAYIRSGLSSERIDAILVELEKINEFIAFYGEANANLVRREVLLKALSVQETRVIAIRKINAEIERVVNLIVDQMRLTLTKFNTDHDQFIYTALKQFNPRQKYSCGLEGTVDERIDDCSYQLNSEKEGFVLVTRSKDYNMVTGSIDYNEVFKEISTGLLWSDRLDRDMSYPRAMKACRSTLKEVAGLENKTWRLPSIDEYKEAAKNGIEKALAMYGEYWSSSVKRRKYAWRYSYGRVDYYHRYERLAVRCVADAK